MGEFKAFLVRFEPAMLRRLRRLALKHDRPVSAEVRVAVANWLEAHGE